MLSNALRNENVGKFYTWAAVQISCATQLVELIEFDYCSTILAAIGGAYPSVSITQRKKGRDHETDSQAGSCRYCIRFRLNWRFFSTCRHHIDNGRS